MPLPAPLAQLIESARIDGVWWRRLAAAGSTHAPEWFKRSAPPVVAAAIFALAGERRRGAIRNLERVLGADRFTASWAALRLFSEFAYCTSEAMEHYSGRPGPLRVDRPERDPVEIALGEGRGVVVLTAHLGNWDIAAKALRSFRRPVNVVMAREVNETSQEFVRTAREQAGVRMVLADTSVFSSLSLIGALRRNEVVAIQLDRMQGAGGVRLLPFLGAPAPFPSGAFVLARLAGAPLVPVFVPRVGRRHYRVQAGERIDVPREARAPEVLDRVMQDAVRQLEGMVRRYPTQWFQFAPFWPEPEPGAGFAEATETGSARDARAAEEPALVGGRREER
jgi:KDO2-lipid IV(A) lauroyltransferase